MELKYARVADWSKRTSDCRCWLVSSTFYKTEAGGEKSILSRTGRTGRGSQGPESTIGDRIQVLAINTFSIWSIQSDKILEKFHCVGNYFHTYAGKHIQKNLFNMKEKAVLQIPQE